MIATIRSQSQRSQEWFPYDRNDRKSGFHMIATIAKWFPYDRNDRCHRCDCDRCDRCDHMETGLYASVEILTRLKRDIYPEMQYLAK